MPAADCIAILLEILVESLRIRLQCEVDSHSSLMKVCCTACPQ